MSDEEISANGATAKGAADAIALGAGAGRLDPRAAAYLEAQTEVLRLQKAGMEEEQRLQISHLRFRRYSDYAKTALETGAALIVALIVIGLGALVWQASQAKGLVAEPLRTPPDFASRGLDGTVLSQQLLDRLNAIVTQANKFSLREPDSIGGSWGSDTKVQIPNTGISIDDLSRLMHSWLGHETHLSGEVYRTSRGIALTVRAGTDPGETFEGNENDLGALLDKAALALLKKTQPFVYISSLGIYHTKEAATYEVELASTGSAADRSLANIAIANRLAAFGESREAIAPYARAIALAPADPLAPFFAVNPDIALDHAQILVAHLDTALRLFNTSAIDVYRPSAMASIIPAAKSLKDQTNGDYADAARNDIVAVQYDFTDFDQQGPIATASDLARDHDLRAARAVLAGHPGFSDGQAVIWMEEVGAQLPVTFIASDVGDWKSAISSLTHADNVVLHNGRQNDGRHTLIWPWLAYAWAKTGNVANARALIAMTPLDCTRCLEFRGRVAEVAGDEPRAAYWYARAAVDAPSLPFALTDWGAMLLHKGDAGGAIAKFTLANTIGPHFADPLELWGEALVAKNRSDLALAKFVEAAKYAPNWGRLHLKWGEALMWSGKPEDAKVQFETAAQLDLTAAEKTELAKVSGGSRT